MRALLLVLFAAVTARGACFDPVQIAVGPRSVQPQCSYWQADVDAEGALVAAAWMTYEIHGFSPPFTTGTTAGGTLDGRGRLRGDEQQALNDAPGWPSVATNGTLSLLAWARTSYGTFAQFLDSGGAPVGARVKISGSGASAFLPRAVWTGRDWMVVFEEQADVQSVRLATDGTILDRKLVALDAKLVDADGSFVVVRTASGFELATESARHPLPSIPAGATVALDGQLLAWHAGVVRAQRLDASGAPSGAPIALANASAERKYVAVAGDVVLWNDFTAVRGTRLGVSPRSLTAPDGVLYGAAKTSEGVVALLSGSCFSVQSYFLAPGAIALEPVETVSRIRIGQSPRAIVPTARGHHAYWSDTRPLEGGTQLFVTHVEGASARPPVRLNAPGSGVGEADAAPFGSGSVVAFAEYPNGSLPGFLKLARVDANGVVSPPLTVGELHYLQGVAVTARGDEITVFSVEHATYASIADLWRSDIRPDGSVTREQLAASIDGFYVDAAMTPAGPVVIWADNLGDSRDTRLLNIRDAGRMRVFPMPAVLDLHRAVDGTSPMILRLVRTALYAFFPDTGAEALVAEDVGYGTPVNATPRADGTFDVAVGVSSIRQFNVTPQGLVAPREELCFATPPAAFSMRAGIVDALLTTRDGGVFVARRPPNRHRAVR
jgi:hypothetical protein